MPRKAKPAAQPIEMPRTEKDFENLITAIETHMAVGNQIGQVYLAGSYTAAETLDLAAKRDEDLYKVLDAVQESREKTRQEEIDAEVEDEVAED